MWNVSELASLHLNGKMTLEPFVLIVLLVTTISITFWSSLRVSDYIYVY